MSNNEILMSAIVDLQPRFTVAEQFGKVVIVDPHSKFNVDANVTVRLIDETSFEIIGADVRAGKFTNLRDVARLAIIAVVEKNVALDRARG